MDVNPTPLPRDQTEFERQFRNLLAKFAVKHSGGKRFWGADPGALGIDFADLWGTPGYKGKRFHATNQGLFVKVGNNLISMRILAVGAYGMGQALYSFGSRVIQIADRIGLIQAVKDFVNRIRNGVRSRSSMVVRNKGNARLDVKADIRANTSKPTAVVRPVGPWHIIEKNTKPHTITPKNTKALRTPYGVKAKVQHPGTKGRPVFKPVADQHASKALEEIGKTHQKAAQEHFKG